MKNMWWSRIVKLSSLVVVSQTLLLSNISISTAQNRVPVAGLEGTEWEGSVINYPTSWGLGTLQCFYTFGKQGKVVFKCLAIQSPGVMAGSNINDPMFIPGTDDPNKPKLVITPGGSAISEAIGKYTQDGSSISIEFSDAVIKGTIEGNVIFGETIYKDANKGREKWVVRRITSATRERIEARAGIRNKLKDQRIGEQVAMAMEKNEVKAKNESKSLSIGEQAAMAMQTADQSPAQFLSKQMVEKYNPSYLTTNTISGQLNPGNNRKQYHYAFTAIPGELILVLNVEAESQSPFNGVQVVLLDMNERVLGSGATMSNYGRTTRMLEKINFTTKQPVLLRIEVSNLGYGKYNLQLSGALKIQDVR